MSNTCETCRHPKRKLIERDLLLRVPLRTVSERYGAPKHPNLLRHFYEHMPDVTARMESKEVLSMESIVADLDLASQAGRFALQDGIAVGSLKNLPPAMRAVDGLVKSRAVLGGHWIERKRDETPAIDTAGLDRLVSDILVELEDDPEARERVEAVIARHVDRENAPPKTADQWREELLG